MQPMFCQHSKNALESGKLLLSKATVPKTRVAETMDFLRNVRYWRAPRGHHRFAIAPSVAKADRADTNPGGEFISGIIFE